MLQGDTSGQALAFVDFNATTSGVCPILLGLLAKLAELAQQLGNMAEL